MICRRRLWMRWLKPIKLRSCFPSISARLRRPVVKTGDSVKVGQVVGQVEEGKLGVPVHASIDGVVADVTDKYVVINRA